MKAVNFTMNTWAGGECDISTPSDHLFKAIGAPHGE